MSRGDIQDFILFEAQRAEEERADTGHVPYHGERENRTVQLQAGRGGKNVERGDRATDRKKQRGFGRQPYAGQNPRGSEQGVSGRVRPRHLCHGGEGAQRIPRHGYESQDAACRVPAAQRGLRQLVGKMKSQRSYWKYCVVYKHLSEFIKTRYKVEDIALKELAPAFITGFELFLRVEKGHCTNTVWSYMMPFRSIIFTAINNGWLQRDPFYAYHITKEETKRGYLTKEEITQMINGTFKRKNYGLIRDLFIFCCFTNVALNRI